MQSLIHLSHKICPLSDISNYLYTQNLFNSELWLNIVSCSLDIDIKAVVTLNEDNEIISIFIFHKKKLFFLSIYGSPIPGSFTPYHDPIILNDNYNSIKYDILAEQINFILKKYKCQYFEFRSSSSKIIKNIFSKIGGKLISSSTYLIDLKSEEFNWKLMKDKTRNMVRKAIKNNIVVKYSDASNEDINTFYNLLLNTFKRSRKKPIHTKKFIKNLITNLHNNDKLLFLILQKEDRVITMGLFAYDHNTIHYISGASDSESFKYGSNNLMQWEVIKFAISKNLKRYDMGGRGIKSIDKFKEGFGGNVHYYGKLSKKSIMMQFIENAYKVFKAHIL